ncbi:MAG: hypothetical protein ACFCVE_03435 [Phycisphaerae bacterium]
MTRACNIDNRGRLVRLVSGGITLVAGLAVGAFWALPTGHWYAWVVAVAGILVGAFGIYEAKAGWCAARAMGFKTPV